MRQLRLVGALLVVFLGLVALTGCGVGPETVPRPLPGDDQEAVVADPSASPNKAGVLDSLWFVQDEQIVPVTRTTENQLTDEEMIQALQAGPTASEAAQGLRTALTPLVPEEPLVITAEAQGVPVAVNPGQTAVVLNPEFTQLPSQEQLLVLGQVVATLADSPDSTVLFVDDQGTPIGIPLPSGRLTSDPVSTADFTQLMSN